MFSDMKELLDHEEALKYFQRHGVVENISIFKRPEQSFKHPNMFRIGFIVFKDHKTARYAVKRCEFNFEGRFLKVYPFVPISKVKDKLRVLLSKRVFPEIMGDITEAGHKQEYDRVNRLKKSLWKKVYNHVGNLHENRVTDDSVADIYNETLAKLLMEEVLQEEEPYTNKTEPKNKTSKKGGNKKLQNSKTETPGHVSKQKTKPSDKTKSEYQPYKSRKVDIEEKFSNPKFSFRESIKEDLV